MVENLKVPFTIEASIESFLGDPSSAEDDLFLVYNIKVTFTLKEGAQSNWNILRTVEDFVDTHRTLQEDESIVLPSLELIFKQDDPKTGLQQYLNEIVKIRPISHTLKSLLSLEHAKFVVDKVDDPRKIVRSESTSWFIFEGFQSGCAEDIVVLSFYRALLIGIFLGFIRVLINSYHYDYSKLNLSFGVLLNYFKTSTYNLATQTRGSLEVCIVVLMFLAILHRLLGMYAGHYLRNLLKTIEGGKFDIHFEWISLRFGLDRNEILISNLVWKNPPEFHETPYFIKIEELSVDFVASSVLSCLFYGDVSIENGKRKNAIRIRSIRFDKVSAYIEKATHGEMNIWAALGAKGEKAQAETQQWIKFRMNQVKNITSSTTQAVLKYNPASLLVKGALNAGNLVVGGTKQALNGADERIPTDKIPNIPTSDLVKDAEKQVGKVALEAECLAAATTQVSEVTPQLKAQMEKKDTKGFGVPYRFEIDRIIIHDLKLFAQDYLSANHTKCDQNSSSAIQISLLHMGRRELTIPGKKRGEYRQGVYLDEAVWRLVNKLVAQLFASNKMAMLSLVSMGAASQTTNAVVGVVKGGGSAGIAVAGLGLRAASDGLSAVANTTTGGIKKTGSVIGNFFTGHK